jgi:N-acetylated-alpha-linked acidic dipeptidase
VIASAAGALTLGGGRPPEPPLRGFSPEASARHAAFERDFLASPTPERARADLRALTLAPRVAGSEEDYRSAQYVLQQFRAAGLEARIVEYHVLLPLPRKVRVDLVEPFHRPGPTPEARGSGSEHSGLEGLPAYNAFSPSGSVEAPVVYANYGLPEDYAQLEKLGVDVRGKIVLARYGRCFRGVKAFVAEQRGAAGLLIYSDPADDGFRRGEVYPEGPWRPATAVQQGSILYLTGHAGDPLTPGTAATLEAPRLPLEQARTLPRIPTAPLSWLDAAPILENLEGCEAPREWQGALPFTYRVGPGTSKVHLELEMDFRVRPIWNVIGEIRGVSEPDSWVILGNHRDAWMFGAVDAASGTAPLLAVARGLGELLRKGWRPRRTILLASWDAEEFGLIGSTEWVEENAEHLRRHAVAYLNMDVGVSGPNFSAAAVPSLNRLLREVAGGVRDPKTQQALLDVWTSQNLRSNHEGGLLPGLSPGRPSGWDEPRVGDLGSGSDYTPFLQHAGVPAADISFSGPYGVYHAAADDFRWMETFGDPTFEYSATAARVFGLLALRLGGAEIVPLDFEDYGRALRGYVEKLERGLKKAGAISALPTGRLRVAVARFTETAGRLRRRVEEAGAEALSAAELETLNRALIQVERDFLLPEGLPGRGWFRHAFYAPGVYTGYEAVIFPGVREAVNLKDWSVAREQMQEVREAIERGTKTLERAVEALPAAPAETRGVARRKGRSG